MILAPTPEYHSFTDTLSVIGQNGVQDFSLEDVFIYDDGLGNRIVAFNDSLPTTASYFHDSHMLVEDLNNWLDKSWSLDLLTELPEYRDWGFCDKEVVTCQAPAPTIQKYTVFTAEPDGGCSDASGLTTAVNALTGYSEIMDKTYIINGVARKGSHIFTKDICGVDQSRGLKYLVKRNTSSGVIENVILAESQIYFNDLPDSNQLRGFERMPRRYGSCCNDGGTDADCQKSNCSNYLLSVNLADSCYMSFPSISPNEAIIAPFSGTWTGGGNAMVDSVNDAMWDDFTDGNGDIIPFTESIGFYFLDNDGNLDFDPIHDAYPSSGGSYLFPIGGGLQTDSIDTRKQYLVAFNSNPPDTEFFKIDTLNGCHLTYISPQVSPLQTFNAKIAIKFAEDIYPVSLIPNVISASSVSFSDNRDFAPEDFGYRKDYGNSKYLIGQKGKFTPIAQYSYKSELGSQSDGLLSYESGIYSYFATLDHQSELHNDNKSWKRMNSTRFVSPDGFNLEDENIIGVKSSALLLRDNSGIKMVATNAARNSIYFTSYEYDGSAEDTVSHSGRNSLYLSASFSQALFADTLVPPAWDSNRWRASHGMVVSLWAKYKPSSSTFSFDPENALKLSAQSGTFLFEKNMEPVVITGDWTLYESEVFPLESNTISLSVGLNFDIELTCEGGIFIDDVRAGPTESDMTCSVYDPLSRRFVAQLDNSHFGTYYKYNPEGKLTSIELETEKGLMTVSETQYNTPQIARSVLTSPDNPPTISIPSPNLNFIQRNLPDFGGFAIPGATKTSGIKTDTDLLDIEIGTKKSYIKSDAVDAIRGWFEDDEKDSSGNSIEKSLLDKMINNSILSQDSSKANDLLDFDLPDLSEPDLSVPDLSAPEMKKSDLKIPDLPDLSDSTLQNLSPEIKKLVPNAEIINIDSLGSGDEIKNQLRNEFESKAKDEAGKKMKKDYQYKSGKK
jgi:hypothetical protein